MKHYKWFLAILLVCLLVVPASAWVEANAAYREQFANAEKLAADKKLPEAEAIYSRLAASNWPAADLAAVRAREIAAKNNRDEQVMAWNEKIVASFPHSPFRPTAMMALMEKSLDIGRVDRAAELAQQYVKQYPHLQETQARFVLAQALEQLGRKKEAVAVYAEVAYWRTGAYASKAESRLAQLRGEGWIISVPSASAMWNKIVEYFDKEHYITAAIYAERFARLYPQNPDAFRAKLVAVDTTFARRRWKEAKAQLATLAKLAKTPEDKLAVAVRQSRVDKNATPEKNRTLYRQAMADTRHPALRLDGELALLRLEWDERNFTEAAQWASKALNDGGRYLFEPASIAWKAGFAEYLAGNFKSASLIFTKALQSHPDYADNDAVEYWLARSLQQSGDREGAKKHFRHCYDRWKGTYYGLLAEVRLTETGHPRVQFITLPDETESERILAQTLAIPLIKDEWEQAGGGGTTLDDGARRAIDYYSETGPDELRHALAAAREMIALNLGDDAIRYLDFAQNSAFATGEGSYFHSVAYGLAGDNLKSIIAANNANSIFLEGHLQDPNNISLKRRFPLIYREMIFPAAQKHGLDPYFVAAVIKQESAFQMTAKSWVGARGLMQIMPGTGKVIARSRKIKNFKTADLFNPEVSLDFGCWLLADYMRKTDGDMPAVLAGYNAGYGRPKRWWGEHSGRAMDEVVELVPFEETRGYIKAIMRNYEMYQRLYKDKPDRQALRVSVFEKLKAKVRPF